MSGDWIKIECCTPEKPEVFAMADLLCMSADEVVGKLIRLWIWADRHTVDGEFRHASSVTKVLLDRYVSVTGFADAMQKVGWIVEKDGGVHFSNFDRHNGNGAEKRALSATRSASYRDQKTSSNHATVTQPSRNERDENVTTALRQRDLEKRREEKRRKEIPPAEVQRKSAAAAVEVVERPKRTRTREPDDATPDEVRIADDWNAIAADCGLPKILLPLGKSRKAHLRERIADGLLANWDQVKANIRAHSFLRDNNDRGWTVTFDALAGRADLWRKIAEGNYRETFQAKTTGGGF